MLFVNRLVHTLVPGSEGEPVDTTRRTNAGFAASLICIGLNITLCLAKGIAGLLAGSVSLIADAFNNLSDASSNIVSLLGFRLASRPADEDHPYGHGRYEYLAGLVVAVLVCAVGINLVLESVTKIIKPSPPLTHSFPLRHWLHPCSSSSGWRRSTARWATASTRRRSSPRRKTPKTTSLPRARSWRRRLFRKRQALISTAGRAWAWASSFASAAWAWCATPSAAAGTSARPQTRPGNPRQDHVVPPGPGHS